MAINILSDAKIKALKPKAKPYRVADGGLLYLTIMPKGAKLWQFRYRSSSVDAATGTAKATQPTQSFGQYPDASLTVARARAKKSRELLARGIDPIKHEKAEAAAASVAGTFREAVDEWSAHQRKSFAANTAARKQAIVDKFLVPGLGPLTMLEIDRATVIEVLRKPEADGLLESVKRAKQCGAQIFRRAMDRQPKGTPHDKKISNPFSDLRGTFATPKTKSHPAITEPQELAVLLRKIWAYPGAYLTGCALKLSAMLFQRPGEVRKMEWAHIDLDEARWVMLAESMKMREEHLIPLPAQAIAILRDVHALTGEGRYVFPNSQGDDGTEPTMSENTVNMAIRRLKDDDGKSYAGRHSAHGFRATARTILDERLGYRPEVIEAQLAHRTPGALGATYARAKFLADRRKMMQAYANFLDQLRTGSNVLPISRTKGK